MGGQILDVTDDFEARLELAPFVRSLGGWRGAVQIPDRRDTPDGNYLQMFESAYLRQADGSREIAIERLSLAVENALLCGKRYAGNVNEAARTGGLFDAIPGTISGLVLYRDSMAAPWSELDLPDGRTVIWGTFALGARRS